MAVKLCHEKHIHHYRLHLLPCILLHTVVENHKAERRMFSYQKINKYLDLIKALIEKEKEKKCIHTLILKNLPFTLM